MALKGNKRHINRLAAPRYYKVSRKSSSYITKPNPGRFNSETSVSLITAMKEKLMLARTSREARSVITTGGVEINGKTVREEKYPVGFGDMIHFKSGNQTFNASVGRYGVIQFVEVKEKSREQVSKVVGKYVASGKTQMVRLLDGRQVKAAPKVQVNDSVVLKDGKITGVIKAQEGAKCMVLHGVHASENGVIKAIKKGSAQRDATVEVESKAGTFETLVDNIIVVGA